jgi:hypothetical protein
MINNNYIPTEESQLSDWLVNFSDQLPSSGVSLGINPAEIAVLNALIYSVLKDSSRMNVDIQEKKLKRDQMLVFVIGIVERMKAHSHYDKEKYGKKMRLE